jgi:uncharacterized OsmC-like protein
MRGEIVVEHIRSSIENAVRYLTEHPDQARYTDSAATATLEEGLRCRVEGPGGASVITDMPESVGGGAAGPSPAWLLRAALASCVASLIAMESAREGLTLERLEVTVDSESDDRGILAIDPSVPGGPLSVRVRVLAEAAGAGSDTLREIVERGERLCPVYDTVTRAVPVTLQIGS